MNKFLELQKRNILMGWKAGTSILLGFAFVSQTAFSWGELGHETTGLIAERYLNEDAKAMLSDILPGDPLNTISKWPDDVRNEKGFSDQNTFGNMHFIDIPNGYNVTNRPKSYVKDHSAHDVLIKGPSLLLDPDVSRAEKAVILKYMIHAFQDVHQPLHVGTGLDFGGNLCKVKESPDAPYPTNLHSFWDTPIVKLVIESYKPRSGQTDADGNLKEVAPCARKVRYFSTENLANCLEQDKEVDLESLNAKANLMDFSTKAKLANSLNQIYKEAVTLRESEVYPGGKKKPAARPYCDVLSKPAGHPMRRSIDPNDIPVLSDAYKARAVQIIKVQMTKAGLRLAVFLNQIASQYQPEAGTKTRAEIQQSVIEHLKR